LALDRVDRARAAVRTFYEEQRTRYSGALEALGFELFTGEGGFYHWGRLPGGLSADAFNRKLFARRAAVLPGPLCDMLRRGQHSPLASFVRFSFGAVEPASFEGNIAILREALA
jgi:DNA-binding transcriptional MocR family regulator